MIDTNRRLLAIKRALATVGFSLVSRAGRNATFAGALAAGTQKHAVELVVDILLQSLPSFRLMRVPSHSAYLPHVTPGGSLCYAVANEVVLDVFDPGGQVLECVRQAEDVLRQVLAGHLQEDLEREFFAYWPVDDVAVLDVHQPASGIKAFQFEDRPHLLLLTDAPSLSLLKLGYGTDTKTVELKAHRIRCRSGVRPAGDRWPPERAGDVVRWLGRIDRAAANAVDRALEAGCRAKVAALAFLIEAPNQKFGFRCTFEHHGVRQLGVRKNPKVRRAIITRIDEGFMAERNIPGRRTLAGHRLLLIGCGTIGGYLAELLVKLGAGTGGGELVLVDSQTLHAENIGRHRLGVYARGANKAEAMVSELQRAAPGASVAALAADALEIEKTGFSLIVDATGEQQMSDALTSELGAQPPATLTVWIEANGSIVKTLLRARPDQACQRCLNPGLVASSSSAAPGIQGCESSFVAFPVTVSLRAASLAADAALDWANGVDSAPLRIVDLQRGESSSRTTPSRRDDCPACKV